ncbi:hypothetical protein GQ457_11G006180 [Hibiscus cannabinus]
MYYKPTFKEFTDNALPTSGYAMLAITEFVGMDILTTYPTFRISKDHLCHKAVKLLGSAFAKCFIWIQFNHIRQDDCSTIECYMEQFGVTAQEAYDEFNKHIESSWKDVNEEFLKLLN